VSLTSPAGGATFTAPANITLTASAADTDGTITKVEFFHGGTNLIATFTEEFPYTFNWTNVAAASYSLTAKATDNSGATTTSAPVNITVNGAAVAAQLHYIHADHLNTPRVITNQAQQVVWRWDHTEPFGADPANSNPSGLGAFEFNLRLPGQYFDKETNLHYNYFRDYDPGIGRYIQSDPIGLAAGYNTYLYVGGNPVFYVDPTGTIAPAAVIGIGFVVGAAANVAGTIIGGGTPTVSGALTGGLAGGTAVAIGIMGAGAVATNMLVGTGRVLLSSLSEIGIEAGLNFIKVGKVISPAGAATTGAATTAKVAQICQ
jgi:RHS repeat-associated protein